MSFGYRYGWGPKADGSGVGYGYSWGYIPSQRSLTPPPPTRPVTPSRPVRPARPARSEEPPAAGAGVALGHFFIGLVFLAVVAWIGFCAMKVLGVL